ncbi:hypothetical protein [Demequina soli]|uniref:hypothetical protein n=1 Tax=Demequina soli TaxID=1638987 RepID=UPI00078571EA|nr:hypothetical protein [Demequina soli]
MTSLTARRATSIVAGGVFALTALTACSSGDAADGSAGDAATPAGTTTESSDARTAAQRVVDECADGDFTLSADGEVLAIQAPWNTDADSPLDLGTDLGDCIKEQGFLDGIDMNAVIGDSLGDGADGAAMLNIFGDDGLVVVADGAFVRITTWDGDEQLDADAFWSAALSQADSDDDFVAPAGWSIKMEMGPDDGTYTDNTAGDGADASAASSDATGAFGEAHVYDDGLSVTIGAPTAYEPSDSAYAQGDHFVAFDVTIDNGTDAAFDPSGFNATVASGDREAEQVFDSAKDVDGSPSTSVQPGRKVTFTIAYGVSDPDDLTMDVSVDFFDHDGFTLVK